MIYCTENHNFDEVKNLLQLFINESVFSADVDDEKVKQIITYDNFLTVVVKNEQEPVALMIVCVYEHPLFDAKVSSDLLVFVKKEHRGGLIAMKLIKMYKNWAEKQGVRYMFLGQSTGIGDINRVKQFYEKLGFQMTGFNCIRGV